LRARSGGEGNARGGSGEEAAAGYGHRIRRRIVWLFKLGGPVCASIRDGYSHKAQSCQANTLRLVKIIIRTLKTRFRHG
jgi:hypothetical protein